MSDEQKSICLTPDEIRELVDSVVQLFFVSLGTGLVESEEEQGLVESGRANIAERAKAMSPEFQAAFKVVQSYAEEWDER